MWVWVTVRVCMCAHACVNVCARARSDWTKDTHSQQHTHTRILRILSRGAQNQLFQLYCMRTHFSNTHYCWSDCNQLALQWRWSLIVSRIHLTSRTYWMCVCKRLCASMQSVNRARKRIHTYIRTIATTPILSYLCVAMSCIFLCKYHTTMIRDCRRLALGRYIRQKRALFSC